MARLLMGVGSDAQGRAEAAAPRNRQWPVYQLTYGREQMKLAQARGGGPAVHGRGRQQGWVDTVVPPSVVRAQAEN